MTRRPMAKQRLQAWPIRADAPMAHRHLRHVQRLCDATLEPALPLQTQCLETTPLPPILQRAFRGFHAYLMPISKIKLHCATISKLILERGLIECPPAPKWPGAKTQMSA